MFCHICNQEIKLGLPPNFFVYHIKKVHGIQTPKEYYDKYIKKETEGFCVVCGKEAKFKSMVVGYKKYCSIKCIQLDPEIRNKRENTMLKKYGVKNHMHLQSTLDKIKKTNLERYGYEHNFKSKTCRENYKKIIKEKYGDENYNNYEQIKKTNLEKYGCECSLNNETVKDKIKKTNLEKYGCENTLNNDQIKNKVKQTNLKLYGSEQALSNKEIHESTLENAFQAWLLKLQNKIDNATIIKADKKDKFMVMKCHKCGEEFIISKKNIRKRIARKHLLCIYCNPIIKTTSIAEQEIFSFCKEHVDDFINGDRKLLDGFEIDIYSGSLRLGIEFNGLYWHSEENLPNDYHYNKSKLATLKGINLIHIWEDQWLYKSEIVKSVLLKLLGKSTIISSGTTTIKISDIDAENFFKENSLSENISGNVCLGFFTDELVSVMVLDNRNGWKLVGHCDKKNITVKDSFNTLFRKFINEYTPESVEYVIDRSLEILYVPDCVREGFQFIDETDPDYQYLSYENEYAIRESKLKIESVGLAKNNLKIYDSGNLRYLWKK